MLDIRVRLSFTTLTEVRCFLSFDFTGKSDDTILKNLKKNIFFEYYTITVDNNTGS